MVGPVEEDFLVGLCQPTLCVLTPRGFVTVVWAPGSKLTDCLVLFPKANDGIRLIIIRDVNPQWKEEIPPSPSAVS